MLAHYLTQTQKWITVSIVLLMSTAALAQDRGEKKKDRFAPERARVTKIRIEVDGKPVELVRGPLYTYEEVIDKWHNGTSWVWGKKGRPAAFLNMMTAGQTRYFEFISLTKKTTKGSMGTDLKWEPKSIWKPKLIKGAPKPASSRTRRLIQMRSLARRFQGKQVHYGEVQRLRQLANPVYRYQEESDESLDGTIFAFLRESDLETILILEAQKQEDGSAKWVFDCMPVSIDYQEVLFDDRVVWEKPRGSYSQAGLKAAPYHIHKQPASSQ